ncbi:MAG TPA: hypothetical protein VEC38_13360 [Candidatus Binataceae bacterium]|nr:hypothetical protein [Candidatus Binataceae bacterium]
MRRSFLIALFIALAAASCSTAPQAPPSPRPHLEATATLAITAGISVLSIVPLPQGFTPIAGHPPLWLQNGAEIGVVGTEQGRLVVLGYGNQEWRTQRVLAAETGDDAAEEGTIVDLAASPDGMTLATAVVPRGERRLDIILRDLIAAGPGHSVVSFDGAYDSVSMSWLNTQTIALALRAHPEPPPPPPPATVAPGELPPETPAPPSEGLQLIVVSGAGSVAPVKLPCVMSPLSWSAHGVYAIGAGDASTPPIAINRRTSTCRKFAAQAPMRVLAWSPRDESSLVYAEPMPAAKSACVFRYDLESGEGKLIAAGSSAAAFTSSGAIIALGNQKLSRRSVAERPDTPVLAQLAIFDPDQARVDVKSLGFQTPPAMLVESTIAYAAETNRAAIETFAPAGPVPMRKIIVYSVPRDAAYQIASGPARGVAVMSWSPKGRWLAIEDGDAASSTLTVIQPPG